MLKYYFHLDLTSFVLGLGVFGFVDVTGVGVWLWATWGCFSVFCGFSEILNEFSFKRPFVQNCMESGFWLGWLFVAPIQK